MTDYTNIEKEVDAVEETIWDVASHVWEFAELGYQEFKSSAYAAETLEKNGFAISDRGIGGLDTSWTATWGSGSPVLGILVEFDALPGRGRSLTYSPVVINATGDLIIIRKKRSNCNHDTYSEE